MSKTPATLTVKQAEVLAVIDRLMLERYGLPPTFREIAAACGVRVFATVGVVQRLAAKGFLGGDTKTTRSFRILRRIDGDRMLVRGAWHAFGWYVFVSAEALGREAA